MAMLAVLQSVLVAALTVVAFGFMARELRRLSTLVATGARSDENLKDAPAERFARLASLSFGHRKLMEDPSAGLLHAIFLFGFFVLGVGHLEVILEGLTSFLVPLGRRPFAYEQMLPAGLTSAYHLSQDLFAVAVLVASAVALARRILGRPPRQLPRSADGERILWFLVALYVTFFMLAGPSLLLRQRLGVDAAAWTQPVSAAIAGALAFVPTPEVVSLRGLGFWAHTLVFLGFAAYLPTTKHMHLVFAWPNLYFFRRTRYGLPPRIDFETTEKFGIDRVQELPWKSLLDSFACTECGRCNAVCPAHATGKPLMPMKVLHDVKVNLRDRKQTPLVSETAIDRGKTGAVRDDGGYAEVDGQVHTDELWACTTCAACVQACPVLIDSVPGTLLGLRQSLVMMESELPAGGDERVQRARDEGQPLGPRARPAARVGRGARRAADERAGGS